MLDLKLLILIIHVFSSYSRNVGFLLHDVIVCVCSLEIGEICWVVYLISTGRSEGEGILVALAAFLALFWLALWKIICLRCCCHRRRICAQKKAQARLEQQQMNGKRRAGGKRRGSTDPEEFETDFHHVNTQVSTFPPH